jgi:hypothetical protein
MFNPDFLITITFREQNTKNPETLINYIVTLCENIKQINFEKLSLVTFFLHITHHFKTIIITNSNF